MSKTRTFSIRLLKEGYDETNALKEDHNLGDPTVAKDLPPSSTLFVLKNRPHAPWWKGYFKINEELNQVQKGAILFLHTNGRHFAITFGHVAHNINNAAYEYDFGLRVVLNCVQPDKLKSTDSLQPSGAKRQRTQLSVGADLTYFDFDKDSTILKSLTGKVKDEHKKLFNHVTGSDNIRVSSAVTPQGLPDLCSKLLELYEDETYKIEFPNIQNISPVKDPEVIDKLNQKMLEAFREKDENLSLIVPELINYHEGFFVCFKGAGKSLVHEDVFISRYFEYLSLHHKHLEKINCNDLKKHKLIFTDENGNPIGQQHTIFKSLIYDTELDDEKQTYHLCEGNWYLVNNDYIESMNAYLDPFCVASKLIDFDHKNEGDFNKQAAEYSENLICLDCKSVAPTGQNQVEPCDILEVGDDCVILHHVKISTVSAQLSHLFNQGINSIKLLIGEVVAMEKLGSLVEEEAIPAIALKFQEIIKKPKFKVVYSIITHKDIDKKSLNLPLFSRISLMRSLKELEIMRVDAEFSFVSDLSPKKEGRQKLRGNAEKGEAA